MSNTDKPSRTPAERELMAADWSIRRNDIARARSKIMRALGLMDVKGSPRELHDIADKVIGERLSAIKLALLHAERTTAG